MVDGVLVGKIFCDGRSPNADRSNADDVCVGVTTQSAIRIECGDEIIKCPGGCS